ncbi:MAG: pilus assembly protein PilM [Planctomycetota bacterium]
MVQLLTRTKTSLISIDLGACSLRAVQLRKKADHWHIHHWLNIEHEPSSKEIADFGHAGKLASALGPGTFSGQRTVLMLNPPEVEYKLLEVPPAILEKSPDDIRNALQYELDRQLSCPLAEAEISVWPVQAGTTSSANAMVASAERSKVHSLLDILDGAGLDCVSADIVPNGMIELYKHVEHEGHSGSSEILWAVLDIGLRSSRLYMMHSHHPVYARIVSGGGSAYTELLAQALHVDFRIAEQYKCIYGIKQTDRGFRSVAGGLAQIQEEDLPGVMYAILRNTFDELCKDIERSYRFALGRLPNVTTGPLYLIGGGARLKGLPEVLGERLGIDVRLPEPSSMLDTTWSKDREGMHPAFTASNFPVLSACIGMAMKEVRE